jgi:hypothetical protein
MLPPSDEIAGLPGATDDATTVTVWTHAAVFPLPSVTVQVTLFVPSG